MALFLLCLAIVGGGVLLYYLLLVWYQNRQKQKYGDPKELIINEYARNKILRYLISKDTTVNRLNVIEDLEIPIPQFKQVTNSLKRDNLISMGPQSIKMTAFGKQYFNIFIKRTNVNGSETFYQK
jgi:predicted methyltransferase